MNREEKMASLLDQLCAKLMFLAIVAALLEAIYSIFKGAGIYELLHLFLVNTGAGLLLAMLLFVTVRTVFRGKRIQKSIYFLLASLLVFLYLLRYLLTRLMGGDPLESKRNLFFLGLVALLSLLVAAIYSFVMQKVIFPKNIPLSLFLAWLLVGAAFLFSSAGKEECLSKREPPDKYKNIVLFTVDALRCDSVYQQLVGLDISNIDQFKNDSVIFHNYFSVSNTTNPSFASLFTGKCPNDHGLFLNGYVLEDRTNSTLAEFLAASGYRTAAFSENVSYRSGLGQGFQYFYHIRKGPTRAGKTRKFNGALETLYYRIKKRFSGNDIVSLSIKWIEENKEDPFFLWVHIYDTHLPYQPPKRIKCDFIPRDAKYQSLTSRERWRIYHEKVQLPAKDVENIRGLYKAEVKYGDQRFGKLVHYLKKEGLYDEALIIFSSDHGEALYEREYWIGHSQYLFDNILRIPLIMKPPKSINTSFRKKECWVHYSNLSLAQTILDLAKIKENFSSKTMASSFREGTENGENDILSLMYDGFEDNLRLAKVAVMNRDHKVVFDGQEFRAYRLENMKESGEVGQDTEYQRLNELAERIFKEKSKKLRTQKIPGRELKRLKSLGYLK